MEDFKIYQGSAIKPAKNDLTLTRKMETGFPSPAADHLEKALDLEELIVHHPAATFYVRAEGNAMQTSGIHDGDILVVDRSINARSNHIVIAAIAEEPVIRRLVKRGSRIMLVSDLTKYEPICIYPDTSWMIWGVVTHVIHRLGDEHEFPVFG
ncbi:MAG: translesion error-prone DNA polymerase V autoproteolytic subunit [Balneolaceae bacterium]|nr:translesion error-prone DNA polymerase V autoproteolytic subunit [Balneolaceae bacterium]